jgi:pimeloyl-ACP methyl ester carboxylesterase
VDTTSVEVRAGPVALAGDLGLPPTPRGVVLFAHGSGSGRHSPRNRFVARSLHAAGFATLLLDLLTVEEEEVDAQTAQLRFDIPMLAGRLGEAARWLAARPETIDLPLGLFGASTGAAAALITAAEQPERVKAVVSRGGRPDLAGEALGRVQAPTLLIVGGFDGVVIKLNESAFERLAAAQKKVWIVPGAGHLFEEPGTLEEVARLAGDWFALYLRPPPL